MFLLSRTEVLRLLDLEPGRKLAITGAPGDFLDWIDKGLPEDVIIDPPDPPGASVVVHLFWTDDPDSIHPGMDHALSAGTEVWIVAPSGAGPFRPPEGTRSLSEHHITDRHVLSRIVSQEIG